jgi:ssDNA-binding Zn-finger/Zn-ribbon topoisomerase 1
MSSGSAITRARSGYTYAGDTDLSVMTCPSCGITYAIPQTLKENAYKKGNYQIMWHCPNGHELGYGQGETERQRKRADEAEARAKRAQQRAEAERDLREHTERQLSAQRGATTRAKKRHAAGVCPCCKRSFVQLKRHMETKHPDYKP